MSDLRSRLRDSGYRLTPQRELILAAVDKLGHATPDEVLAEVREHSSAVNASTVYRTLEVLEGLGLVRHAHLSDRAPTYHSVSDHEHFHLVCRNCGRVVSVGPSMLQPLTDRLRDEQNFVVDVGHLTVFGACVECPERRDRGSGVTSPLLGLPGAVSGDGIDAGVAAHYGSFNGEQRALEAFDGFVDLSHRDVVRISGPDRLTWLHSLTTQYFEGLAEGVWTEALILSPQGHVEHAFAGVDDGEAFTAQTEPGRAAALVEFLDRMRFLMRVEVADVTDEVAVDLASPRGIRQRCRHGVRPGSSRTSRGVRRRGRPAVRQLGVRGAAHRPRRAAVRSRHRPPHDPQRGGLDRARRAPRQGLLPRPGDRRAGAHARPPAPPVDPAAPRRHREPPAPPGRRPAPRRPGRRLRSAPRPATTSSVRSRWPWSSATSRSRPPSTPTGCPRPRRSWSTPRSGCTSVRTFADQRWQPDQPALLIIPAPTVTPVASSTRMNDPVVRFLA